MNFRDALIARWQFMRNALRRAVIASMAGGIVLLAATLGAAQAPAYRAPRTADGKPNLNGIWQALNSANWVKLDPEVKCYLPGVPRATYLPYPFQIVQGPQNILISYEFAGAVRTVNMGAPTKAPGDSWMGWSNGHWEGETLVVDVTSLMEDTWFDRAGNFHSDALHVVERYTPRSADTLTYEATIEDPKIFSRPWKISMPLYRHVEKDARLLEYKCVEFAEELLYGPLSKKP